MVLGVAYEHYDVAVNGALQDLGDVITEAVEAVNNTSEVNHDFSSDIPIQMEVIIYDGADGFGGLPLITRRTERETHDHGIG